MRRVRLAPLLFTCISSVAAATDSPFECKYDGNQQEMNACAVRDYKAADVLLNATYKQVMSALPPAKLDDLRRDQRAWLKQRDPKCKADAKPSEGGSIWPLEYFGCLQTVTEARTKELERWRVVK
jgi:uncharacterized protein YecT (DUF1311 family)